MHYRYLNVHSAKKNFISTLKTEINCMILKKKKLDPFLVLIYAVSVQF